MSSRISPGPEAQDISSALKLPDAALLAFYSDLLRGLQVAVVVLASDTPLDPRTFRIVYANSPAAGILGSPTHMLFGGTLADFPRLLQTQVPAQCLRALRSGKASDLEEISFGDGPGRQGVYSVRVYPLSHNFLGLVFENVTSLKIAEQTLRESEERFRSLVQGMQEYAIFQLDSLGRVVSWNAAAEQLKGYRAEEIIGKYFSVFYLPEDVQSGKPEQNLKEAARKGQCEDEGWRIRKDGSRFWANVVIAALRDPQGDLRGFAKLTRDMTERHEQVEALRKAKEELELRVEQRAAVLTRVNQDLRTEISERLRIEEELRASLEQLRALAARLQHVREEERTLIAREIHDELGQACTAVKMDLAMIGRKITKRQQKVRARVGSAIKLVDNTIATLRRIASELRPRTLDDLGLTAALEWQAQEFQSRTGIPCRLTLPQKTLALDAERSTAIFRIFQESLTNVARHAEATRVEARLERKADQLIFQVHDNGRGFNAEEAKAGRSLGLVGMQERALLLNGELRVEGVPGAGTTMTLRIPLTPSGLVTQNSK